MFRSSLVLIVLLTILPAQETTKKPGAVEGVVSNSLTGAPIRKARVTLTKIDPRERFSMAAVTDPVGRFLFENVDPGLYMISAAAQGFTSQLPGGRGIEFPPVKVAAEQRVKGVAVKLTPMAVITGKVLDDNREPLSSVRVEALQHSYSDRGTRLGPRRGATTDDRGEYRIFDLPADRYYLRASGGPRPLAPGGRSHSTVPEEAYAATYHPGVPDAAQATPVETAPGAELLVDFRLPKIRVYHVRGKVSSLRAQGPNRGTQVRVEQCGPGALEFSPPSFATVQPDGTFDAAGVAPGSYCVTLDDRREDQVAFARQAVTVTDRDVDGVLLLAGGAVEIRGTAIVEGAPADGLKNVRLTLNSVDTSFGSQMAVIKEDGTFGFRNVTPQTWQLTAIMMPKLYLKSIRFGDQEAPDGRIQVTPAGGSLTLVFASDTGEVSGTVQSSAGEPAKSALVIIAPEQDRYALRRDLVRTAYSRDGKFRADAVPPGEYKVFGCESGNYELGQSADLRKLLASRAVSVTVHVGGRETVQVNVIPREEIEDAKRKLR